MIRIAHSYLSLTLLLAFVAAAARAQSPSGPIPPKPGIEVQLPPKDTQAKVKVQVTLVNTPVTVRNGRGDMVHNLEARDFQVTDNNVAQSIAHFDLGGDPLSLAILIETSSRIAPLLAEMRKTGILFTQTVMGPTGEATDAGSEVKLGEVLRQAQLANITIYSVGLSTTRAELQAKPKDTRPQITPPGTFPLP